MLRHLGRLFLANKKTGKRISDVTFGIHERVVTLKKGNTFLDYIKRNKFNAGIIALGLVIFVVSIIAGISYASEIKLYSTSCLGGWQNTGNAEGKPQVKSGDSDFTLENSAVLDNKISQIFCGGFKGDIPEDSEPKKIYVAFSWGTENTAKDSATIKVFGDNFASSTNQIIDLPVDSSSQFELLQSTSSATTTSPESENKSESSLPTSDTESVTPATINTTEQSVNENQQAPAPEPVSVPEVTPASEPTSFIFKAAHADDSTTTERTVDEGFLEIKYTIDGQNWNSLGKVSRSTLHSTRFELPMDSISGWLDVSRLQISIESVPSLNDEPKVYLDSVWVEVEYEKMELLSKLEIDNLPRVEVNEDQIFDKDVNGFQSNKDASFEINLTEPDTATSTINESTTSTDSVVDPVQASTTESVPEPPVSILKKTSNIIALISNNLVGFFSFKTALADVPVKKRILDAEIISPDGSGYDEKPIIEQNSGLAVVRLPKTGREFKPGIYKLKVEVLSDNKVLVTTKDFAWGVLAINTDQSSYLPGEKVYLQMGALDDVGHTLCDANLSLTINGSSIPIKNSDTCGKDNVTENPDYYALYTPTSAGVYSIVLKNLDNGFSINDSFEVSATKPFIVERSGATRINPFASSYKMKLKVRAYSNFHGHIIETIPDGFTVATSSPNAYVETVAGVTNLIWNVNMLSGNTLDLEYTYNAKQVSPEIFTLGPVILESLGQEIYKEERSWQLASDAACIASATGDWNAPGTWTSCGGGVPGVLDSVTINSGVTVTVTANASSSAITISANASTTASNGIIISGTNNLAVTGAIAMTAPTQLTSTIDVGAGSLSAASIAVPGSTTAGRFNTVSVSTGSITTTGSITFSGTAAQARFTSTGASTVTVGGNFGAGGTLTTSSTGTIKMNGGVAQTLGAYATYNNIEILNTSGGVSFTGAATTTGTLMITSGNLTMGAFAFKITGTTTVSSGDSLIISSATGIKRFGDLVINNGGTMSFTAAAAIVMDGNLQNDGTLSGTTGTWTFQKTGGGGIITGTAALTTIASATFTTSYTTSITATVTGTLTVTGAAVVLTNNGSTTVTTALSGTGGVTQATSSVLNIGGTSAITTLTASTNPNTVNYTGGAQTIKPVTYHHLGVSGSGAKTVTSLTTINGNLTWAGTATATTGGAWVIGGNLAVNGGTLTVGAFNFTVTGTTTINGGTLAHSSATGAKQYTGLVTLTSGTWSNAGNSAINYRGGLTVNGGTFTSGTGVYTFDTNVQSVSGSAAFTIASVTVTGITLTNSNTGGFTISTTLAGTGGITQDTNNPILNIGAATASFTLTTLTASASGNIVNYNGTSAQTVRATTYHTLKSNNTTEATLGGAVTLTNLTIGDVSAASILDDGGFLISPTGTSTISISTGGEFRIGSASSATVFPSFTSTSLGFASTVTYKSSVAQNITAMTYGGNLNLTGGNKSFLGNTTISGSYTQNITGTVNAGSYTHFINLGMLLSAGTFNAGTSNISIKADISGTGTFNGATSTVIFTVNSIVTVSSTNLSFYNLIINNQVASNPFTFTSNVTINNSLQVNTGIVDTGSIAFTNNGSTTIGNGGELRLTSTTGAKIFVGLVTINGGGTWNETATATPTFRGGLTVMSGSTFTASTGVHTFDTNSQSIGGNISFTIPNVTVTGITLTNNNTAGFTVSTALSGTGEVSQGTNSVLNIGGTSGITTLTANANNGNTVNYNGAAQTVKAVSYRNLTLSGSGVKTITSLGTVNGNLTMSGSASATTSGVQIISGKLTLSGTSSFTMGGFNTTIGNGITIDGGTINFSSLAGSKDITGAVLVSSGTWSNPANEDITIQNGSLSVTGGNFTSGSGTIAFSGSSAIIGDGIPFTIQNLSVAASLSLINYNTSGLTISSSLSGAGTFTQGADAILNLGGTSAITGFDASATGNTVDFNGVSSNQTIPSATYYNLITESDIPTASYDVLGGNILVLNSLTISNSSELRALAYSISLLGNWTNNGTFTPGTGIVQFSGGGDQTIIGSNSWYDLNVQESVARTLYFESGSTQTINAGGSLTLKGGVGNMLTLAPLTPATDWLLRIASGVSQDISYVDVSHSDAGTLGVDAQVNASDGTNNDGGGNTNWNFTGTISFSISDNTIGFGTLNSSAARYATGDTLGSDTPSIAHTLSAVGPGAGYSILVQGDSLKCGGYSIDPIGGVNTASNPGIEQFGIRLTASGGTGSVSAPYSASGYAYNTSSTVQSEVASALSADSGTTYSVYYIANIAPNTESCNYSSNINYVMVPNF